MQGLGKRLQREVAKSPVKSSVLGLVILVAIWYWAPLIGSWLPGGATEASENLVVSPEASKDLVVNPAPSGSPATSPVSTKEGKRSTSFKWQTVVGWLAQDFVATPAMLPDGQRDPFKREKSISAEALINQFLGGTEEELDDTESQRAAIVSTYIDLSQLPLVLGGTIVGKRIRSATINGNAYREGGKIPVIVDNGGKITISESGQETGEKSEQRIELDLEEVHPRYVVIKWQEKQRRLEMERTRLAPGDRIVRGGETDGTSPNVNSES